MKRLFCLIFVFSLTTLSNAYAAQYDCTVSKNETVSSLLQVKLHEFLAERFAQELNGLVIKLDKNGFSVSSQFDVLDEQNALRFYNFEVSVVTAKGSLLKVYGLNTLTAYVEEFFERDAEGIPTINSCLARLNTSSSEITIVNSSFGDHVILRTRGFRYHENSDLFVFLLEDFIPVRCGSNAVRGSGLNHIKSICFGRLDEKEALQAIFEDNFKVNYLVYSKETEGPNVSVPLASNQVMYTLINDDINDNVSFPLIVTMDSKNSINMAEGKLIRNIEYFENLSPVFVKNFKPFPGSIIKQNYGKLDLFC